jgi:hypothetical protein
VKKKRKPGIIFTEKIIDSGVRSEYTLSGEVDESGSGLSGWASFVYHKYRYFRYCSSLLSPSFICHRFSSRRHHDVSVAVVFWISYA